MKKIITLCLSLLAFVSHANVGSDLDDFFNGLGYASNATTPAAFESQAAGFFGGGSLYARNQVRNINLVQLDLPNYRAGCGGIDLFTGGLSFLSEEKLVDLGKSIMTNAGAYAVDVALATTVPELKQVRDYLQHLEQMANQASINSCEMAQNFVGGVWPKTAASQQKICKDQGTMGREGLFTDYVKARMACSGNDFDRAMTKASHDERVKKQVVLNKNLIWALLHNNPFLSADNELAEMIMSLTGTLIINAQGKVTSIPSLAESTDLIQAMLGTNSGSQQAKIWHCSETNDCLQVRLETFSIPEMKTLTYRIREMISSINSKLNSDKKPTPQEINFLSLTSLPVMKFLSVLNESQYGAQSVDMEEYAELIAYDLLTHYLSGLLTEVNNATAGSELPHDLVKLIEKRISDASRKINTLNPRVGRKLKEKLALIEHIARIEKQVALAMSNTAY